MFKAQPQVNTMELLNLANSWLHIITAALSLVLGTIVVATKKGTRRHKTLGNWYIGLMVVNNFTSLFIVKVFGHWFFPHYLAQIGLVVLVPAYLSTRWKRFRHWLKIHILCMMFSYYLLVGGAVNEAFLHIPSLRPLIVEQKPEYQFASLSAFLVCLVVTCYFLFSSRKRKATA